MAPQQTPKKDRKAIAPNKSTASTKARVIKPRYEKVRFHKNGLLDVERKAGKYFKLAQQNQRQSPLLLLPAELRNKIFAYALGGKTFEIKYQDTFSVVHKNVTESKHTLALLQVCRQIYAETALLPFSTNIFSSPYPYIIGRWAARLHPTRAQNITWVQLKFMPCMNLSMSGPSILSGLVQFEEPLLSSEICNRGYVALSFDTTGGYSAAAIEKKREDITRKLQALNEGVKFVWE